jgi:hypothetical protein
LRFSISACLAACSELTTALVDASLRDAGGHRSRDSVVGRAQYGRFGMAGEPVLLGCEDLC